MVSGGFSWTWAGVLSSDDFVVIILVVIIFTKSGVFSCYLFLVSVLGICSWCLFLVSVRMKGWLVLCIFLFCILQASVWSSDWSGNDVVCFITVPSVS